MADLLSARQVAELLGITVQAVHGLRKRKRLPAYRVGLAFAFRLEAVEDLKNSKSYRQLTRRRTSLQDLEAAGQIVLLRDLK